MTLQSGNRIGSYEILSPLGAGGMGEVWRAHDTRIDRVAVRDDAGRGLIYPTDGGEPVELQGLTSMDQWIRWSADGNAILVFRGNQLPVMAERIDIASGRRQMVLTIEPTNRNALLNVGTVTLADDETHYAYDTRRTRRQLFTIEGLG